MDGVKKYLYRAAYFIGLAALCTATYIKNLKIVRRKGKGNWDW